MRNFFRKHLSICVVICVALFPLVLSGCGQQDADKSEDPAAFYDGKQLTIIVPYNPGGGYDIYARLTTKYLEKYIPGVTVVVMNRPGAGSLKGTNEVFTAKPDGLTIGMLNVPGCLLSSLTEQEAIQFKVNEFNWLGRVSAESHVLTSSPKSQFKTIDDVINSKEKIKVGTDGVGSDDYYALLIELNAFDVNKQMITGYSGTTEANLAVVRNEANITQGTCSSSEALIKSGDLIPLMLIGSEISEELKVLNLPFAKDLVKTEIQKAAMKTVTALFELDRCFATTPNVPEERVAFLRDVFNKVINDPEFQKDAMNASRPVSYKAGTEIQALINSLGGDLEQVKPLLKQE